MKVTSRKLGAIYGVSILAIAAMAGVTFAGLGVAAAGNQGVAPSCVDSTGGAAYVTDSGLTVYENDPDVDRGNFGASGNSATFGHLTLSAAGNAAVRVDDAGGTSGHTCLGNVEASANPVTIDPAGAEPIVLESDVSGFAYRDPVYEASNGDADLAFEGSASVTVTVESTGLAPETTVVAEDVDSGTALGEGLVESDGAVTLSLASSPHRVDLLTERTTDTPTPTPTPDEGAGGSVGGGDTGGAVGGVGDTAPTETPISTETVTPPPTPTPTPTEVQSTGTPDDATRTETTTATEPSSPTDGTTTAEDDDGNVPTGTGDGDAATGPDGDGGGVAPLLGAGIVLVVVAGVVTAVRRRQ